MPIFTVRRLINLFIATWLVVGITVTQWFFPGMLPDFFTFEITKFVFLSCIPLVWLSLWLGITKTVAVVLMLFAVDFLMYIS